MDNEYIVAEYDYYTLDQARKLIYEEMRHNRLLREHHRKQCSVRKKEWIRTKVKEIIKDITLGIIIASPIIGLLFHWILVGY